MRDFDHLMLPKATTVLQDAGFFRRMFAFIFDILLIDIFITAPFTDLFTPLMKRISSHSITELTYTQAEITAIMIIFLIIFTYFVLFEYLLEQTPGMMLLEIRAHGDNTLTNAMLRNSFIFPVFPFIMLWFIEPIAIMFYKRSLCEYMTGTRTVRRRTAYLLNKNR